MMIILLVLFVAIVLSLIWARFFFFKMTSGTPRLSALLYDAIVATQIITTLVFMFTQSGKSLPLLVAGIFLYSASLLFFWWAIFTAKKLDFAFSNQVGNIVTTGPFRIVRHPFYTSYILSWFSSALLFNSLILWITLLYLIAFYFLSARKEEGVILKSVYSDEYKKYIQNVGMFLPRMKNGSAQIQDPDTGKRD
ncbi:MAG: isoprenylcysteine carboxylmethyltransferase family protein [Pseudomonadales bacterium]|nr:isoprenylcysteine carboxylmethyltransferase family protein [Pseudomonadales bacterium]MCP5330888.1 isoprenylcysteine carboxylmethyltransferase family protein [Pseudomonadales bacterium]MCP5343268.1 isoprenylcysteine carboxylmethyltransferase family protein [Pseudomonadales bacterium]